MNIALRTVLIIAALLTCTAALADELRTFELKHRNAEDIIPLLRPLLGDGAALSGRGDVLLIRAPKPALKDAQLAIKRFDTPLRQLIITVRQGDSRATDRSGFNVTTRHGVRVYSDRRERESSALQHLRTLEGHWARITTGDAVPETYSSTTVMPGGAVVRRGTQYRQFDTGFEVRPRVTGERVQLTIRPFRAKPAGQGGRYETADLATTVEGALGEWIDIGGAGENRSGSESGLIYHGAGAENRSGHIHLKVELTH
jgi:hypothetical protein